MSETAPEFPPEEASSEQDAMAAEWEAALAQQSSSGDAASADSAFAAASQPAQEVTDAAPQMTPAAFANFGSPASPSSAGNDISMILDIPVQLTV